MGAIGVVETTLASAVANAGTVVVNYPSGLVQADLTGTTGGRVAVGQDVYPQAASGAGTFAVTFGASNITITNNSGISWPAGAKLTASFGRTDIAGSYNLTFPKKTQDKVNSL